MILIIDNYDSFTYNLYQLIAQATTEVKVARNDKINVEEITELSPIGIVLSPGPGKPEDAGICLDTIRHFSGDIPILGVCLGQQAIAVAFDGNVVKSSRLVHGESSIIFHHQGKLYNEMSLPFQAGLYHSLMVEKESLPSQLNIEAETADEIIMGIKHTDHPTFGIQFHPESILSESGAIIIKNFIAICEMRAKSC